MLLVVGMHALGLYNLRFWPEELRRNCGLAIAGFAVCFLSSWEPW